MIFDNFTPIEVPEIGIVVKAPSGRFVSVWITEEQLFRAAIGDEEFDRRVAEKDAKAEPKLVEYCPYKPPSWWQFWR